MKMIDDHGRKILFSGIPLQFYRCFLRENALLFITDLFSLAGLFFFELRSILFESCPVNFTGHSSNPLQLSDRDNSYEPNKTSYIRLLGNNN